MTREIDWKVHEYMGNDLTGWEPRGAKVSSKAIYDIEGQYVRTETIVVPHYSTTWEGAGMVVEWLKKKDIRHSIKYYAYSEQYEACIADRYEAFENSAPLALCKAYISAMEERENG